MLVQLQTEGKKKLTKYMIIKMRMILMIILRVMLLIAMTHEDDNSRITKQQKKKTQLTPFLLAITNEAIRKNDYVNGN